MFAIKWGGGHASKSTRCSASNAHFWLHGPLGLQSTKTQSEAASFPLLAVDIDIIRCFVLNKKDYKIMCFICGSLSHQTLPITINKA